MFLNFKKKFSLFTMGILCGGPVFGMFKNAGEKYCDRKEWEKAAAYYKNRIDKKEERWENFFNLGVASHQMGQWEEADRAFEAALERCRSIEDQEGIFYNRGNTIYRRGELLPEKTPDEIANKISVWEDSLKSYASALDLKKKEDSRHNYDWVKSQIDRLRKEMPQQGKNSSPEKDSKKISDGKENDSNKNRDKEEKPNADNGGEKSENENKNSPHDSPVPQKNLPKALPQNPPNVNAHPPKDSRREEMENLLNASKKEEQTLPPLTENSFRSPSESDVQKDW